MSDGPSPRRVPSGEAGIACVVYGVKSTPDEKESVTDQHRIVRKAIEKEGGRKLIAEPFGEANASGYRKERGPQLEAAMRAAVEAALEHGEAELWVWHSSRLARGDGTKGSRSIQKVVVDLRYGGVTVRSATDPEMVTPMLAGIASVVSNKYSADLSAWTKAGLDRRRRRGAPLGALPWGFEVEREILDNRVITRRRVDPALAPVVREVFERMASGATPGAVARWLNGQGIKTRRDTSFTQRSIRKIVANEAYQGEKGYPGIVTGDLAVAARQAVKRLDPSEIQRRKGGRRPNEPYMLRSIAFCGGCGAPLYRTYAYHGGRAYACSNKLQSTGLCDRPPIPAELLEIHVLNHLGSFVGSVEKWIAGLVNERNSEAAAAEQRRDAEKAQLAGLDRQREQRMAELTEIGITSVGMEVVKRLDRARAAQEVRIAEAEAMLAEWSAPPDVNGALDFYNGLVDVIEGLVKHARGVLEMNEALSSVLAGLWCELDPDSDYDRLLVQFAVRGPITEHRLLDGSRVLDEFVGDRLWLPPVYPGTQTIEPLETAPLTTVSACLP